MNSNLSVESETVASVSRLSLSFGMFSARMWSDAYGTCSRTVKLVRVVVTFCKLNSNLRL